MTLPTEAVTLAGSGLVFINQYDASVSEAYRSAIITAENVLQSHFTNPVTASVDFTFAPLSAGSTAENIFSQTNVSYSSLAAALKSHAVTADDRLAANGLPSTDPSNGAGFAIANPQARILGLAVQSNKTDDTVTLNSNLPFSFGQDAVGAIEHELTEGVFGRTSSLGVAGTQWEPLDLYRFTAGGQRDVTGGADGVTTFFGLDAAHVSSLAYHNSVSASGVFDGQDLGDWSGTRGDAFGPGGPNSPGSISATDLQVLDVLGWNSTPFTPAADDFASSLTDVIHPFGQIAVGGSATGTLQQAGDHDWFAVTLLGGDTFTITESGHAGGGGTVGDPFLQLRDSGGNVVASNDDISSTNPDSRLSFAAATGGLYYVDAGGFVDGYSGTYTVSLAQTAGPSLPPAISSAFAIVTRASAISPANIVLASAINIATAAATMTTNQAIAEIVQGAQTTTSVATLAYEFFIGKAPSSGGMDYLISPTGPNPNNLNAAYYQAFSLENRYINFAVNLGKVGEGNTAFTAKYGALTLFEATRTAYATIFGEAPSDAKLHAILDPTTVLNGVTFSRSDYFAYYGQDGANGIGTKAAMVGYLLAEAEKADVGTYALSNDAFLTDVALHNAPFGVDLVGVYNQPGFVFHPG